ncbi:MAG: Na(+)/H(+) antiporter subunit D [Gemmatimonas sp.]|nr:Na(+)/H(+) antiporter subunit D [Gemmatimonas sp.]
MLVDLPPFVPFFVAALLVPFLRGWARAAVMLAVPVLGGLNLVGVGEGVHLQVDFLGYVLTPYRVDRLSLLFGYLFHIAAFLGILFALHLKREDRASLQHAAALLYAGGGLGVVFAGDLITLFVFWEILALASVFLIWAQPGERAVRSGLRYLAFNILSGLFLLSGTLIYSSQTGSIEFNLIGLDGVGSWLIFLAFGIKAGFPLLHTWITDAYPEATATGAVFLSAFTTKAAVYALARGFPGTEVLIYIGVVMTCFPIFYAVIENNLRRVLAYSMINQVGFMVVGIGLGTELALNGAVSHAFNDVIFKGLLFMSMGAVLHMTGRIHGSDLGGLYKSMPLTTIFCIVGAASISAFPLFSGFVSKSMVMTAAIEEGHTWIWLALLFASAGVLEHAGIKIPFFAFFAHDSGIRTSEPPRNMLFAMGIAAALCIAIGSFPTLLYDLLPWPVAYEPYDLTHVLTQLQLLFFAILGVVWLMRSGIYPPELPSVNLDSDWLYRRAAPSVVHTVGSAVHRADAALRQSVVGGLNDLIHQAVRVHGPLARSWPVGSMVLWVAIMLVAYLLLALL